MKKVLFTATVDSHILQFHLPFLKLFKDNGYEVHVATNGDEKIPYCDVKHVISFERSPLKLNNLKAIKDLKKIINKEKFDIIHCHTPMGSVVTRLAAKKARKNYHTRVIYTAHGFHFYKGASIKNWLLFYPVEKHLAKYTDTLITINKEDYELANKKFSKRCRDIQYVPGVGIDENKFNFRMTKKEKIDLRKSLGLKENDFVMIYPAELSNRKRQIWLINALSNLLNTYKDIHLLLPGKDSLNEKCQDLVKKIQLEQQIHFLGYRTDIPKLLKVSDLSVSSANQEGLPVNIMEAMYVGLPIVASDCRGNRDLVKDGKNGYVVNSLDKETFKQCVEKLYLEKNYQFGMKSKELIKDYILDEVIIKMKTIYFRKKKVLHLLASNSYSGAENVVCTIIDNFKDKYDFYYCSPDGSIREVLQEKNINFIPINKLNIKEIKKIIRFIKPDIIHAHDIRASILASYFYKNARVISHLHKNDPKLSKVTFKYLLYLLSINKYNAIVGVSNSVYEEFFFKKLLSNKYMTINNYVNYEEIIKKSNEKIDEKEIDCCFIGRLVDEKKPIQFINIINKLKNNDNKIKAVIIGDGPLKEQCLKLINDLNIKSNIKMIGFKENPYPYLKHSKCCIITSKYEGFGLVAIESMIVGTPVLNSGVGGLKSIFTNSLKKYICEDLDDYIYKYNYLIRNNDDTYNFTNDIKSFIDFDNWRNNFNELYK